jgi:hypothetical protein
LVINAGTNMLFVLLKLQKPMVVINLQGLVGSLVNSHDGVFNKSQLELGGSSSPFLMH